MEGRVEQNKSDRLSKKENVDNNFAALICYLMLSTGRRRPRGRKQEGKMETFKDLADQKRQELVPDAHIFPGFWMTTV